MKTKPKQIKHYAHCTEDQKHCWDLIEAWIGSHNIKKIFECGRGLEFCTFHEISTHDTNRMTTLVLLAHQYRVRVEVTGAAPNYLRIRLHARDPKATSITEGHPGVRYLAEGAAERKQWR